MDAKQATMAVRDYFESIKKIKFFFEVSNAKYDEEKKSGLLYVKYKMFLKIHLIHIRWELITAQEIFFMSLIWRKIYPQMVFNN